MKNTLALMVIVWSLPLHSTQAPQSKPFSYKDYALKIGILTLASSVGAHFLSRSFENHEKATQLELESINRDIGKESAGSLLQTGHDLATKKVNLEVCRDTISKKPIDMTSDDYLVFAHRIQQIDLVANNKQTIDTLLNSLNNHVGFYFRAKCAECGSTSSSGGTSRDCKMFKEDIKLAQTVLKGLNEQVLKDIKANEERVAEKERLLKKATKLTDNLNNFPYKLNGVKKYSQICGALSLVSFGYYFWAK